ncbi:MAG: thioredoxin family protein, partial [Burkholderiaceae bacterium]
ALADGQRLVACLCAGWCSSCAAWHGAFAALAQEFAGDCFVWIDIEDHAELVADVEVETLPVMLVQTAQAGPGFVGPIEPRTAILRSLLQRAHQDDALLTDPGIRNALLDNAPNR